MAAACGLALAVSGCRGNEGVKPPPRSDTPIEYGAQPSTFAVPLNVRVDVLRTALEREIPQQLYTMNKHVSKCVPSQKVKVLGTKIPVTPKLACDVAIYVTRGPLGLSGKGRDIVVTVPIRAHGKVSKVAGVLYETANGTATARVTIRLNVSPQWNLSGKTDLSYDWKSPPTMVVLGQRITFTDKVDEQLRPIVAKLERALPREFEKIRLRAMVQDVWGKAFTVLSLNKSNPPVWMRITPEMLMYGGYSVQGTNLNLALGISGTTETFVGDKPQPNTPTALPAASPLPIPPGRAALFVPVIASYDQIEPVILQALVKRSQRPFDIPKAGPVLTRFDAVEAYATSNDRVAVGLTLAAWRQGKEERTIAGKVWLTGVLINPENTRTLTFRDLHVEGVTNRKTGDLILRVANHPGISEEIADALTQNLDKDYNELLGKVDKAISERREGDFLIRAEVQNVRSGSLKVAGQGLYLPVWAEGKTSVSYRPR